jgi:flagellar biosynthetic protein FliQ
MQEVDIAAVVHSGMLAALKMCAPLLLAALVAGLIVAILQAVTQISDSTVSFLPKLCATLAVAYYAGPFMGRTIGDLMRANSDKLILIGGQ